MTVSADAAPAIIIIVATIRTMDFFIIKLFLRVGLFSGDV
jgi:hypothetical protein